MNQAIIMDDDDAHAENHLSQFVVTFRQLDGTPRSLEVLARDRMSAAVAINRAFPEISPTAITITSV